jgi:hypothetical protein
MIFRLAKLLFMLAEDEYKMSEGVPLRGQSLGNGPEATPWSKRGE